MLMGSCAPCNVPLLSIALNGWIYAVKDLAKRFMAISEQKAFAVPQEEAEVVEKPLPELSTAKPVTES